MTHSTRSANNLSLQGRMTTVFKSTDNVAAFKTKLELWRWWVNIGISGDFETLAEILKETEQGPSFSLLVHDHLSHLSKEFVHYFPTTNDSQTGKEWIQDPFWISFYELTLSMLEEDLLLDTSNDSDLKSMLEKTLNICTFWIKVKVIYPEIEVKALKACLHFQNPTFEKPGFLQGLNQNKITKQTGHKQTPQVSLSAVTPRWDHLVTGKQAQGSHWFWIMVTV